MSPGDDGGTPAHDPLSGPADTTFPAGVALTAVMMARERQVESERADRLFDDPWGGSMVAAGQASAPGAAPWLTENTTLGDIAPGMAGYVPVRTRWIDDRILAHVHGSDARQVVVLGSGLDTRAARLPWPDQATVYLLDLPAVVDLADTVLAAATSQTAGRAVSVATDLSGDWATDLHRQGFVAGTATVWVIEGVLMYLNTRDAERLITLARELSGSGSCLIADLAHPHAHHNSLFASGRQALEDNRSPLRSSVADPEAWFATLGWTCRTPDPLTLATEYRRTVPPALDPRPTDGPSFWLLEAWPR
jgi:methyltransferase (TIGR00027 family)